MSQPIIESTLQQTILKENAALVDKYKKYITPLQESMKKKGKSLDWMQMGVVLNNLKSLDQDLKMYESTKSVNVGTFIQHGYDLVTAIYPNLVSNIICATQPLQSRSGEVWFYDLVYETAKGFVSANDPALSATTGVRVNQHFSSEYIDQTPTGLVNGVNATFTGTIPNAPLRTNAGLDFFVLTDGVETFTVNPLNFAVLVGDLGGTGTLNVTSGAYSVTFNTAPIIASILIATGKVNFEDLNGTGIGKTKISLVSKPIYSQKHQLVTDYTLDSELDLNRNFGMNMSDELIKGNAAVIRAELDQLIMNDIKVVAKNPALSSGLSTWSGVVPSGIAQLDHFRTLVTMLKKQSNDIYAGTRMVHGNFIIAGNDISTILEVLPEYRPNPAIGTELTNSGPYVAGTIASFIHIKNPVFSANEWVVGNRGTSAFNTGYILAPYKPLMVTDPVSSPSNPFQITRGLWLDAGRLVVNAKFYAYGKATGITF